MAGKPNSDVSSVTDRLRDVRLETGRGLGRVFRDWMALAVHAFERDDDAYLDRLERYERDNDDTRETVAQTFSEALGALIVATSGAQRPVVGDIYEQVGNQADDFGQYFTPWNICRLKAELLLSADDIESATADDPLTIADPACGSGRLLVATAKVLHERDPNAAILVQGTDKDRTCARMAVVNLVIAGIPGRIRYGDSLTQEIHRTWLVEPNGTGPVVRQVDPDTAVDDSEAEPEGLAPVDPRADGSADFSTTSEQSGLGEWS